MNDETHIDALPHAAGIEKATLSVFLQYPESWHEKGDLSAIWYYLPANRLLFEAIEETVSVGNALELVSFVQLLADTGRLSAIGGPGYVTEVYGYQPSPSHLQSHIGKLRSKLACRMVIETAATMREVALQAPEDSELIDCTGTPITAILDTLTGSKPAPDAKELGKLWWENYQKLVRGEKLPMGIQTGIWEIDNALRGLHPGHIGVISARSSGGKSTLATQIMCGIASPENPVIYLPLEGTVEAAYSRCIIQISKLEASAITSPAEYAQLNGRSTISKEEEKQVGAALRKMVSGGFHFDPPANRKIQTIISTIRRAHRRHGIKVAFVDYVQLIRGEKGTSKEQEMMGISNSIQELAAELGIFIGIMSQENSDGETKHARAIEEDSDWTLSVVQDQVKTSETYKIHKHILITKDRHNGKGGEKLPLILDRKHVRFIKGKDETENSKQKGRNPANF
jgi:replicative DNA helicase